MEKLLEIVKFFPMNLSNILYNTIISNNRIKDELQEIRIRIDRPLILKLRDKELVVEYKITQNEILQIVERLCENSIYAYRKQLCEGYITIRGGHRVGITGTTVVENGEIINIKYITSLNFRIAREVPNCSNRIIRQVIDISNQTIFNTLIVSPPGKGKTTILRDLIRNLSNGVSGMNFKGKTCGVVDERGEIAAMYRGIPQNDIGIRTDIIDNVSKAKGIKILIRTMAPEIIACDEVGGEEDIKAIEEAMLSGVKGIFTMHGKSIEDVHSNKYIKNLIDEKIVEKIIFI